MANQIAKVSQRPFVSEERQKELQRVREVTLRKYGIYDIQREERKSENDKQQLQQQ
jgi:hypothetical protein